MSLPLSIKVTDIKQENSRLKTYTFKYNLRAKAGQFIMVWMPGVDEVPMSIGWQADGEFKIGLAKVGDCTTAIFNDIKIGDRLGIRGPYGSSFKYKGKKKVILVGGGFGTLPMLNLAQETTKLGIETTVLLGSCDAENLLYEKEFKSLEVNLKVATDDGSRGHKGYITDILEKELSDNKYDCVYTCGPELMMVRIAKLAEDYDTESQVSLERYMKCGFGVCGQCCIDGSGARVCKEGPVFDGKEALSFSEFGKYHRDAAGIIKSF